MAVILQTAFSYAFYWCHLILNKISLKVIPQESIDNKSALVQAMVWHRTGDKSLPEPMMAHLDAVYICITGP